MITEITTPHFPEAMTLPEQARAIVIRDQATYTAAANLKISFAGWRKRIVEEFAPMKDLAHKTHKAITSKEAEYLAPVTEAEDILKRGLKAFADEQDRLRHIEQRRLEAVAREDAEKARLLREAAAAVIRAADQKAMEEASLNVAIATGADEAEQVNLPALDDYMEPAPFLAPVFAAPTFTPAKGLGIVRTWGAMVADIRALAGAVYRGEVPQNYVEGNMVALNQRARADRSMMKIPGVVAVEK